MSTRCHHCGGKFGLVRRTHGCRQFCSSSCLERYLKEQQAKLATARKQWLSYLGGYP
jgi:hypothetical protein